MRKRQEGLPQKQPVKVSLIDRKKGVIEFEFDEVTAEVLELFAQKEGLTLEGYVSKLVTEGIEAAAREIPELQRQVAQQKARRS